MNPLFLRYNIIIIQIRGFPSLFLVCSTKYEGGRAWGSLGMTLYIHMLFHAFCASYKLVIHWLAVNFYSRLTVFQIRRPAWVRGYTHPLYIVFISCSLVLMYLQLVHLLVLLPANFSPSVGKSTSGNPPIPFGSRYFNHCLCHVIIAYITLYTAR